MTPCASAVQTEPPQLVASDAQTDPQTDIMEASAQLQSMRARVEWLEAELAAAKQQKEAAEEAARMEAAARAEEMQRRARAVQKAATPVTSTGSSPARLTEQDVS